MGDSEEGGHGISSVFDDGDGEDDGDGGNDSDGILISFTGGDEVAAISHFCDSLASHDPAYA